MTTIFEVGCVAETAAVGDDETLILMFFWCARCDEKLTVSCCLRKESPRSTAALTLGTPVFVGLPDPAPISADAWALVSCLVVNVLKKAALKVQRSTMKCCAFDCRQEGMIKAHDADLRGVCRIGGWVFGRAEGSCAARGIVGRWFLRWRLDRRWAACTVSRTTASPVGS